jgi:hypothetical protein
MPVDAIASLALYRLARRGGPQSLSRRVFERPALIGRRADTTAPHEHPGVAISFAGHYLSAIDFRPETWTCFGNEAADDLFQTSIDPAPRMRAFS